MRLLSYVSIEGQGHFFTIYFPGCVCFVLYLAKISGERLQDHWSSGLVSSDVCRAAVRIWLFILRSPGATGAL